MKQLFLFIFIFTIINQVNGQKKLRIKNGTWRTELNLNETIKLPFKLEISKNKKLTTLTVINGEEKIMLRSENQLLDTFIYSFPLFNTELRFHVDSKKKISGYWNNYNKKDYKLPFTAVLSNAPRFDDTVSTEGIANFKGKWETYFDVNSPDKYPALGVFEQNKNKLTGTFLTETGDYRFLEGNAYGPNLYLSCFDGSHAFLFTGELENGKINGKFLSGKHWSTDWTATQNEKFELINPDSLTYVSDSTSSINFTLNDLKHKSFTYPNDDLKDKVVIIQIMGTWCPNCMDETRYFKELYTKYHKEGLEIISICYEAGENEEDFYNRVKSYKEKLNLDFTFLIGGKANKGIASEHFNTLNQVISFPTSIFIDRNGTIQRIHTGFNGPSTGVYYTDYVTKTNQLIIEMLGK